MKEMQIWKLTPVSTDDPMWQASSHRGAVVVRAPDEESARAVAQKRFGVPTRFAPGTGLGATPWKRPHLVATEIVEQSAHDRKGPLEVLEPSFGTDLKAHPPPKPPKK